VEGGLGRLADLGADVAARDRIGSCLLVEDAPAGERGDVNLVEGAEAVIGERRRRPELARAEGRQRPPARLDDLLDALEALHQWHGIAERHALDAEAGLGCGTSGILENAGDEAVAAGGKDLGGHALVS
jgi:hypothetical protein